MSEALLIFQKYMGTGLVVVLFLAALVYLFLQEQEKERRILFVYLPVIFLLLFFNPLFAYAFNKIVGSEIYFRLCWLLPIVPVLAYSVVHICEHHLKGKQRGCFLIVCVLLVIVAGKPVYDNPLYSPAQNPYHVPDSVVHICDSIRMEGREVMAVFPEEMLLYVRQYSAYVCMPYGRIGDNAGFGTLDNAFYEEMEREKITLDTLMPHVNERGCHYLILSEKKEILGDPQDFNLTEFIKTDGYVVYRNNNLPLSLH